MRILYRLKFWLLNILTPARQGLLMYLYGQTRELVKDFIQFVWYSRYELATALCMWYATEKYLPTLFAFLLMCLLLPKSTFYKINKQQKANPSLYLGSIIKLKGRPSAPSSNWEYKLDKCNGGIGNLGIKGAYLWAYLISWGAIGVPLIYKGLALLEPSLFDSSTSSFFSAKNTGGILGGIEVGIPNALVSVRGWANVFLGALVGAAAWWYVGVWQMHVIRRTVWEVKKFKISLRLGSRIRHLRQGTNSTPLVMNGQWVCALEKLTRRQAIVRQMSLIPSYSYRRSDRLTRGKTWGEVVFYIALNPSSTLETYKESDYGPQILDFLIGKTVFKNSKKNPMKNWTLIETCQAPLVCPEVHYLERNSPVVVLTKKDEGQSMRQFRMGPDYIFNWFNVIYPIRSVLFLLYALGGSWLLMQHLLTWVPSMVPGGVGSISVASSAALMSVCAFAAIVILQFNFLFDRPQQIATQIAYTCVSTKLSFLVCALAMGIGAISWGIYKVYVFSDWATLSYVVALLPTVGLVVSGVVWLLLRYCIPLIAGVIFVLSWVIKNMSQVPIVVWGGATSVLLSSKSWPLWIVQRLKLLLVALKTSALALFTDLKNKIQKNKSDFYNKSQDEKWISEKESQWLMQLSSMQDKLQEPTLAQRWKGALVRKTPPSTCVDQPETDSALRSACTSTSSVGVGVEQGNKVEDTVIQPTLVILNEDRGEAASNAQVVQNFKEAEEGHSKSVSEPKKNKTLRL